jgi:hypothetical protein
MPTPTNVARIDHEASQWDQVGNLVREGDAVHYEYRGKDGKTGKRERPRPAYEAIVTALAA